MAKRRRFSAEFKREAVELTRRPQASVSEVAQELGVNANVLSRWRRELAKPGKGPRRCKRFAGPRLCGLLQAA
ncbi:MAG: transposase [Xanthomonadaceae bacterium]|nr:transposase [Xanthomonadaceae bacterium]